MEVKEEGEWGVGGISRVGVDVKEIVKRFFLKTELQRTIVTVITNYTNKIFLSNQKPNLNILLQFAIARSLVQKC